MILEERKPEAPDDGGRDADLIKLKVKGTYKKTMSWLEKMKHAEKLGIPDKYGQLGVEALSAATPVRTGETANSWYYEIEYGENTSKIIWSNSNVHNGFNVAIGLQYGHGTGNGGYVVGVDYINPAMEPIFKALADSMWKEIISL